MVIYKGVKNYKKEENKHENWRDLLLKMGNPIKEFYSSTLFWNVLHSGDMEGVGELNEIKRSIKLYSISCHLGTLLCSNLRHTGKDTSKKRRLTVVKYGLIASQLNGHTPKSGTLYT